MPPHDGQLSQVLIGLGELKTSVAVVDTKLTDSLKDVSDHESRIRALERFRFSLLGAGIVGGAVASWLINHLGSIHP